MTICAVPSEWFSSYYHFADLDCNDSKKVSEIFNGYYSIQLVTLLISVKLMAQQSNIHYKI